jgi:hypothetical protein
MNAPDPTRLASRMPPSATSPTAAPAKPATKPTTTISQPL